VGAGVTDAVLAAAWVVVLAPGLCARGAPSGHPGTSRALRVAVLAMVLAGVWWLERSSGGRLVLHPALAAAGLALAAAGAMLHRRARRALGPAFATRIAVPRDRTVVTGGPYATVRHPVYAAVLLVAAGTALAHPSVATLGLLVGLAAGIALKIRREEALLARELGAAWNGYAARVPAIVPRFSRAAPP
jgi:protein-S-isoprenylcysteine O-methyltransferase Ste14